MIRSRGAEIIAYISGSKEADNAHFQVLGKVPWVWSHGLPSTWAEESAVPASQEKVMPV